MGKTIGLAVLLLTIAGAASAGEPCKWSARDKDHGDCRSVPIRAPEINPGSAVAGITLLVGGLAVLRARRSKKSTKS